jgi:hypothetical protein
VPLSLQIFSYAHRVYAKTYKRQNNTEAKAFNFTFRYIDEVLSIDNPLDSINLSNKDLEIKTNQHKELPLPHFLTFTSNLTPMANYLPVFMTKDTTSILPL